MDQTRTGGMPIGKFRWQLDLFEQAVVLVLYFWLISRIWPDNLSLANWYPLLILLSEGVVVFFLLIRRRTERISINFFDWIVAFGGTFLALLVSKGGEAISNSLGVSLLLFGFFVHFGAKLSLARSFGVVAADRGIKAKGLYGLVRHPMYAGYILSHIGFLFLAPSIWNLSVYLGAWLLFLARVLAEERILRANPEYVAYMARVRYRILPGLI